MMKICVLQFLGTNCEYDTKYAFEKLGANVEIVWHQENKLPTNTSLVVIPGGFSYGDYLRSGALAKNSNIMNAVKNYANNGGYVLGICNGFQILTEAKLLPGALIRNDSQRFISKYHYIKIIENKNKLLSTININEILKIPVAHHDGNYFIDDKGLELLKKNKQILLQYCDINGQNKSLNGSTEQIAGICNKEKNIFGLMPHPERAIEELLGSNDGIKFFRNFLK